MDTEDDIEKYLLDADAILARAAEMHETALRYEKSLLIRALVEEINLVRVGAEG